MKPISAIVVGAGVIGVATAYELARRDVRTTLVEAGDGVGLETSYANGGLLTPSMAAPWNAPGVHRRLVASFGDPRAAMKLRWSAIPHYAGWGWSFLRHSSRRRHAMATRASFRLARYSVARTRALHDSLALEYDAQSRGILKVFRDERTMADASMLAEELAPLGLNFRLIDGDRLDAEEPALAESRDQLVGGIFFPDDETGDAYLFCMALASAFEKLGGVIRTGARALAIAHEAGRVTGVETEHGMVTADVVVVAAANDSASLVRPFRQTLRIRPVQGYSVTFDVAEIEGTPRTAVVDDAMHAAATPLGSRLRLAGAADLSGPNPRLRAERVSNLIEMFTLLYPSLSRRIDPSRGLAWTGLRPMSADGLPYIGPSKTRGLYVNAGHGHLGWTMACGSAHLLADLILGEVPSIDPAPFRLNR